MSWSLQDSTTSEILQELIYKRGFTSVCTEEQGAIIVEKITTQLEVDTINYLVETMKKYSLQEIEKALPL